MLCNDPFKHVDQKIGRCAARKDSDAAVLVAAPRRGRTLRGLGHHITIELATARFGEGKRQP